MIFFRLLHCSEGIHHKIFAVYKMKSLFSSYSIEFYCSLFLSPSLARSLSLSPQKKISKFYFFYLFLCFCCLIFFSSFSYIDLISMHRNQRKAGYLQKDNLPEKFPIRNFASALVKDVFFYFFLIKVNLAIYRKIYKIQILVFGKS